MTGQHQYLPVCKMLCEQAVFDALRYRVEVDEDGTRRYYNSAGELHRDDGSAVVYADETRQWYQNDKLHRTDGPAVVGSNGQKFWYINGVELTEAEFNQRVKLL